MFLLRYCLISLSTIYCLLFFLSCARQGYPTGGPKDVTPPKAVSCKPANETRNFKGQQFFIEFDEYVVLKNANDNVLVSPPLKQKPEYTTKGKGVLVKIKDTLQENTTYLFQFKEAIADFTEGNVMPSYEYVFSTGATMDTLMMAGKVDNARDGKPWKETLNVLAYRIGDTLPSFITRTDTKGNFAFHYISAGDYYIIALEDKNRNMKVDEAEAVAWDTMKYSAVDSIDSSAIAHLRISAPDRRMQRVVKSEFTAKGRIVVNTLLPMQHPVVEGEPVEWRLNSGRDTLKLWCRNELCDSTVLILTDEGFNDTLRLRYRAPSRKGRGRGPQQTLSEEPLMKALCSGSNAYYDDLRLAFSTPVTALTDSLTAEIMYLKDSSLSCCPILLDSTGMQARLSTSLRSGETYRVRLRDSLFADFHGHLADSLVFMLTPKDYGVLSLHIDNRTGYPLVVEVLDKRDTVVQQQTLHSPLSTLKFSHLSAGDYRLRAVVDRDSNGSWTPGDYLLKRQPEEFYLYEKTLSLREKWEMEETWIVGAPQKKSIAGRKLHSPSKTGTLQKASLNIKNTD